MESLWSNKNTSMAFANKIRLPLKINKPQFPSERNVFRKANGETMTISAIVKKLMQGETELLPESWHEKISIALNHDVVLYIDMFRTSRLVQEGSYEIAWPDFLDYPVGKAAFQATLTPFDAKNTNCDQCAGVTTWVGINQFCQENTEAGFVCGDPGHYPFTGWIYYPNREKYIDGVPTGIIEANDDSDDPNFVPPVYDPDTCPDPGCEFATSVVPGSFAPPDAELSVPYFYSIPLKGTQPITINSNPFATSIPTWMTAAIVGCELQLSGTPGFDDTGFGVPVKVTLDNCGVESGVVTFDHAINMFETGRSVFVINNSDSAVQLTNSNGHTYLFNAFNADDGNIVMPTDTIDINSVSGDGSVQYAFIQTMPSTIINSGTTTGGFITTGDLANTNYLRFND